MNSGHSFALAVGVPVLLGLLIGGMVGYALSQM